MTERLAWVEKTENWEKIQNAKKRFGIGDYCPCDKDNKERYCISTQCANDIMKNGKCHCGAYRLKGTPQNDSKES